MQVNKILLNMKRKISKFKIYSYFLLVYSVLIVVLLMQVLCHVLCTRIKGGNVRDYTDLVVVFTVFLNYLKKKKLTLMNISLKRV